MAAQSTRQHMRRFAWIGLLVAALALSACGSAAPPAATDAPAATQSPGDTQAETGETPSAGTAEDATAPAARSGERLDLKAGLAELAGYRATLTTTFDGTRAGQPAAWARTYTYAASAEPAARTMTVEASGTPEDDAASGTVTAEVEGVLFTQPPSGTCVARTASEETSALWVPASVLPQVTGAQEAGAEAVNGIDTLHYTFDQSALTFGADATASGDVWIAQAGGYVVKYALTVEGVLGDQVEGTRTWAYELAEAGEPVAVALPEGCPLPLTGIPLPEDAANVRRVPGLISFETALDLEGVASFYTEQLAASGWQPIAEPLLEVDVVVAEFVQGEEALSVIARTADAGTRVNVVASAATVEVPGMPAPTPTP